MRAIVALGCALTLAACGRSTPSDDVRATVEGFAGAVARHDVQALCDRWLAPGLVDRVERAGLPCEAAVRPGIDAARRPALEIRSIEVDGDVATARVHSTAANQPPSDDTLALRRVKGRWYVDSLATAGPQPPPAP